jgi:hypothetical protein
MSSNPQKYAVGDVANGHILTKDGAWVPAPVVATMGSNPQQQYAAGDVANGHVLTKDGAWVPVTPTAVPVKKKRTWVKVLVVLGIIGTILTVGAVACTAILAKSVSDSVNAPDKPGTPTASIGSPAEAGDLTFTVNKVKTGVAQVGGKFGSKAQGQYVLVTVTVKNTSAKPKTLWESGQTLFDNQGRKFDADTMAGIEANGPDNQVFIKDINPGNSVTGVLVYDLPPGAVPASLTVHDGVISSGTATISLS